MGKWRHREVVTQRREGVRIRTQAQALLTSSIYASGRVFLSSLPSLRKETPGFLDPEMLIPPEVALGTNRKMGGGSEGLHKAVTSKVAATGVLSLGPGRLARGTSLHAEGHAPSLSDRTSSSFKGGAGSGGDQGVGLGWRVLKLKVVGGTTTQIGCCQ